MLVAEQVLVVPVQGPPVVPHTHTLFVQVLLDTLQALAVPHLQTPAVQMFELTEQAAAVPHVQIPAAEQVSLVPVQSVSPVPHRQTPALQVLKPEHAAEVPHKHTPFVQVFDEPEQAALVPHKQVLVNATQVLEVPVHAARVPHTHVPDTQLCPLEQAAPVPQPTVTFLRSLISTRLEAVMPRIAAAIMNTKHTRQQMHSVSRTLQPMPAIEPPLPEPPEPPCC